MIASRLNFITISLPSIDEKIGVLESEITKLRKHEKELTDVVVLSETYEDFEQLISEQNERYKEKGEYESKIQQIESVERSISEINLQLNEIEEDLFSEDYTNNVQSQLDKFNRLFTQVSKDLYDEEYVLKFDIENFRDTSKKIYKFSSFNANLSSGKKMGEISCFDIAYTIFARENGIPHLPFLLNDKRELMSDNQLVAIADIVNQNNIQFVASILKDKLPEELKNEEYYILKLSEHDKLFRV
jgi:uncharacterized protein YydD (DUF2326 family)